ncbi:hypothetical protein NIES25_15790 [Nostoc linckia NIES-25]|nr:hypothetical protein NIES25_15790 [Nostoc linckia NIES-25]
MGRFISDEGDTGTGSRGQEAGGRGKELETNHLYQVFREMVLAKFFTNQFHPFNF